MSRIPPELLSRIAELVEDYQLQELIEVLEAINQAGRGYGRIELVITNHAITDIAGTFTRKPRRNQEGLARRPG